MVRCANLNGTLDFPGQPGPVGNGRAVTDRHRLRRSRARVRNSHRRRHGVSPSRAVSQREWSLRRRGSRQSERHASQQHAHSKAGHRSHRRDPVRLARDPIPRRGQRERRAARHAAACRRSTAAEKRRHDGARSRRRSRVGWRRWFRWSARWRRAGLRWWPTWFWWRWSGRISTAAALWWSARSGRISAADAERSSVRQWPWRRARWCTVWCAGWSSRNAGNTGRPDVRCVARQRTDGIRRSTCRPTGSTAGL